LFAALIHTLGRGQALNQAFGVLRLMAEHNVKPNQIIYTSLIQASVNAKQIQRFAIFFCFHKRIFVNFLYRFLLCLSSELGTPSTRCSRILSSPT
jgi:hypothetical protein